MHIHYTSHGRSGRDPRCAACGQDISPNDVEIIEHGILWVGDAPYHPCCFTQHASQLKARIAELEAAILAITYQDKTGAVLASYNPFVDLATFVPILRGVHDSNKRA